MTSLVYVGNLTNSVGKRMLAHMSIMAGNTGMSTTSIHVTLPKALKEHIEKRVTSEQPGGIVLVRVIHGSRDLHVLFSGPDS